ncbi:MAG: hypothetical protein ABI402_20765 [Ferruginibacter sp.]
MDPKTIYTSRLSALKAQQKKLQQKKSVFGILRFGAIAAIIAVFYFLWSLGMVYVFFVAILLLIVFVWLIYNDLANKAAIKHVGHLIAVNEAEVKALDGHYQHFHNGDSHLPKNHLYASDIDIFGHASLYQFLNRTSSDMGAGQLAHWLLNPATAEEILSRQNAIKELSKKILWRHELQAYGNESSIKMVTYQRLQQWIHEPTLFLQFKHWKWLRIVLPAISISIVTAALSDLIPMSFMYLTLLIFAAIAYQINKIVSPLHDKLSKIVDEIEVLSESVMLIEKEKFESPLLVQLQQKYHPGKMHASIAIRHLKKILDRLDLRYNIAVSAPLNLLLLWNLQQALDLEKWKQEHAADVENWFKALGEIEALNSFATIHFNNPAWCFPVLVEKYFFIEATELGHPLISENKRVNNFIKIDAKAEIMLVTGSNMAGKSTYLRSVGVNVVLAMAGAPVCAAAFKLSPVQLVSSMRIADNLEESTSTFYAELKKLKTVIDKVNNKEEIFILLDEILRGTNSLDRHTGSVALIRQLIKQKSAGIIATHDLALADIKNEFPANILNYHFDAQVEKEELFFDYKLKPGVCESLNASILMKKIGIEL